MNVNCKRVYDTAKATDGYRVLVDGIWPRGVSKEEAKIDEWKKNIAPSSKLRKQFHQGSLSWGDFRRQYLSELKRYREEIRELAKKSLDKKVTLVYASADRQNNNAVVVQQYMKMLQRT